MESETTLTEYQLRRGDELLGTLTLITPDFPWMFCKFEPCDSFTEIRALFEEELRLLDREDWVAWEQAYEKIRELSLQLMNVKEDCEIEEFLLHIDGDEAWFRY